MVRDETVQEECQSRRGCVRAVVGYYRGEEGISGGLDRVGES